MITKGLQFAQQLFAPLTQLKNNEEKKEDQDSDNKITNGNDIQMTHHEVQEKSEDEELVVIKGSEEKDLIYQLLPEQYGRYEVDIYKLSPEQKKNDLENLCQLCLEVFESCDKNKVGVEKQIKIKEFLNNFRRIKNKNEDQNSIIKQIKSTLDFVDILCLDLKKQTDEKLDVEFGKSIILVYTSMNEPFVGLILKDKKREDLKDKLELDAQCCLANAKGVDDATCVFILIQIKEYLNSIIPIVKEDRVLLHHKLTLQEIVESTIFDSVKKLITNNRIPKINTTKTNYFYFNLLEVERIIQCIKDNKIIDSRIRDIRKEENNQEFQIDQKEFNSKGCTIYYSQNDRYSITGITKICRQCQKYPIGVHYSSIQMCTNCFEQQVRLLI